MIGAHSCLRRVSRFFYLGFIVVCGARCLCLFNSQEIAVAELDLQDTCVSSCPRLFFASQGVCRPCAAQCGEACISPDQCSCLAVSSCRNLQHAILCSASAISLSRFIAGSLLCVVCIAHLIRDALLELIFSPPLCRVGSC